MQLHATRLSIVLLFFLGWTLFIFLSAPVTRAETQIQTGTTPATAYLQVGNQVLFDQPGFHLSQPILSPDGRWLAVTLVPTGAGTVALAETYIFDANDGQQIARLTGYSPSWSVDSTSLSLETEERSFVYYLLEQRLQPIAMPRRTLDEWAAPQLPVVYPETIRVAHHPSNGCRDVADGQVDVIPFEEYVAQVVPAEVPASWPAAALEAMAVAARTYAWRQILVGRSDYDVTDWANFQMMCADRYPSTDAAVSTTAGQYLTSKSESPGTPISAMYSAENGHPTLTNANVTYLQAVPDLFALGRERWGHGYGLSQWGAYRRALAGQNYRQILGHYYSAVYLQNGDDLAQPAAGLLGFLPQSLLTTDSLHLTAIRPADGSARIVITATAGLTAPVTFLGDQAIWRAPQTLPENTQVTAQLWLQDQLHDQVTLLVDHTAPTAPTLQLPLVASQPVVSFTLPVLVNTTPLIATNWAWQGEALHHTANSGALTTDLQAADGTAWQARAGVHQKGAWYGPYTSLLPAGYNYRALFWLRAGNGASAEAAAHFVARLDVTDDDGDEQLGLRDLWTSDFVTADQYVPIAVDFHLFQAPRGLEFRVAWSGLVDLALDRVEIWRLPDTSDKMLHHFTLPLYGQMGDLTITGAQMDSAGNLSQSTAGTIALVDSEAPLVNTNTLPTTWLPTNMLTVSVPVTDNFSGLDVSRGGFAVVGQAYSVTVPASFSTEKLPWQGQLMTATMTGIPDGEHLLSVQVVDRAGNVQKQSYPLRIDTVPPTVTIQISGTALQGWYGEPLTLFLSAADKASGVAHIEYAVSSAQAAESISQPYLQPITLTTGGLHEVVYGAVDQAGNVAAQQRITVALDLAAPVVRLQQETFLENRVRISWQFSDDGAGVDLVEMQIQAEEGEWQPATWDYITSTTTDIDLNPDYRTKVRARAQDRFGRMSEWVTIELWRAVGSIYLPLINR